jgi:hypothetical protein
MSLADFCQTLDPLQQTLGASGTWLFAFGPDATPVILGGSLREVMQSYDAELCASDPLQTYCRSMPKETFASNARNDLDVPYI